MLPVALWDDGAVTNRRGWSGTTSMVAKFPCSFEFASGKSNAMILFWRCTNRRPGSQVTIGSRSRCNGLCLGSVRVYNQPQTQHVVIKDLLCYRRERRQEAIGICSRSRMRGSGQEYSMYARGTLQESTCCSPSCRLPRNPASRKVFHQSGALSESLCWWPLPMDIQVVRRSDRYQRECYGTGYCTFP